MKKFVSLFCLLIIGISVFSQGSWEKKYDKAGIVIHTRKPADSKIEEFKATCTLDCDLESAVAVLYDYPTHGDWMFKTDNCKLVKKKNEKQNILYYTLGFPWPITNRDLVTTADWSQDATTKAVTLSTKVVDGVKAEDSDYVRMKLATGIWRFTPTSDGKVKVYHQYKSDPGDMPAWLINAFLVDAPKENLETLQARVKKAKYKDAKIPWLL